jgi:signal transduction histidine kinase/CheY-like chemotaxis protein
MSIRNQFLSIVFLIISISILLNISAYNNKHQLDHITNKAMLLEKQVTQLTFFRASSRQTLLDLTEYMYHRNDKKKIDVKTSMLAAENFIKNLRVITLTTDNNTTSVEELNALFIEFLKKINQALASVSKPYSLAEKSNILQVENFFTMSLLKKTNIYLGHLNEHLDTELKLSRAASTSTVTMTIKLTVVLTLFTIILFIFMLNSILKRLGLLDEAINDFELYGVANNIAITGDNEISKIMKSFNELIGRVRNTEKILAEQHQEIISSSKLATLGEMSAGIAHEINNPLAYISLNLEEANDLLISSSAIGTAEVQERIKDAQDGLERISKIVKGLKTFSRAEDTELHLIDLNQSLQTALNMSANEIKYRAKVATNFEDSLIVHSNDGLLVQVFLNLLINAAHAIKEGDVEHNEISIRTWREGDEIFAAIKDSGSGIEEQHLAKIFDLFFTTKTSGIGTGLGLAISQSIIKSQGGRIEVQSFLGKGTTMLVRLPFAPFEVAKKVITKSPSTDATNISGRILIIDDEVEIRKIIIHILTQCEFCEADSGESAKNILLHDRNFDFIICDMTMPQISGIDLYHWLVGEDPILAKKVIFITGGAYTKEAKHFADLMNDRILEKPFSLKDLIEKISKLKDN